MRGEVPPSQPRSARHAGAAKRHVEPGSRSHVRRPRSLPLGCRAPGRLARSVLRRPLGRRLRGARLDRARPPSRPLGPPVGRGDDRDHGGRRLDGRPARDRAQGRRRPSQAVRAARRGGSASRRNRRHLVPVGPRGDELRGSRRARPPHAPSGRGSLPSRGARRVLADLRRRPLPARRPGRRGARRGGRAGGRPRGQASSVAFSRPATIRRTAAIRLIQIPIARPRPA